jgi:CubicO group peptidase (beta-lactamase class C family)
MKRLLYNLNSRHRLAFLLASLLILSPVTRSTGAPQTAPDFAALEAVVLAELKATQTPGAALGIVRDDRLIYAKGFGVANVETGAPVTPEMLFRLGSTTKMFTAAALLQLAEAGKLKLDAPIGQYATGLSPKLAQLTSHQLLTHTAGLRDDATMFGKHDDAALGETVRGLKDDFVFTEPGRIISYSNPGYWLAGYVTEAVSGKHYADQLETTLFKPLGMKSTTLRPTLALTWPLAQGHEATPPKVVRPMADNAGNWPAGSIFSSVLDLSRWVRALLNGGNLDGEQLLSPALIAQLSGPHAAIPGTQAHYGYGLTNASERGVRLWQHSGSRSGYGSSIILAPEHRTGLIILVNRTGGSLPKTTDKALAMLLPLTATPAAPAPQPVTEAEAARCAGLFAQGANRTELITRAGKLFLKRGSSELPVSKIGVDRYRAGGPEAASSTIFTLVFDANGQAEYFHAGLRSQRRVK